MTARARIGLEIAKDLDLEKQTPEQLAALCADPYTYCESVWRELNRQTGVCDYRLFVGQRGMQNDQNGTNVS